MRHEAPRIAQRIPPRCRQPLQSFPTSAAWKARSTDGEGTIKRREWKKRSISVLPAGLDTRGAFLDVRGKKHLGTDFLEVFGDRRDSS